MKPTAILTIILAMTMTTALTNCGGSGGGGDASAEWTGYAPDTLDASSIITIVPNGAEPEATIVFTPTYVISHGAGTIKNPVSGISYQKTESNKAIVTILSIWRTDPLGPDARFSRIIAELTFTEEGKGTVTWEYNYNDSGDFDGVYPLAKSNGSGAFTIATQ